MGLDKCVFELPVLSDQGLYSELDLFFLSLKLFGEERVLVFENIHDRNSLLVLVSDLIIFSL